eukprot:GHVN01020641.1.p1 GENE.GHVN01020641.1~~GHVN01020641.1.p1  ORF type:complete len:2039 (+),score=278.32 GHVN01020641.1:106-6222(+)
MGHVGSTPTTAGCHNSLPASPSHSPTRRVADDNTPLDFCRPPQLLPGHKPGAELLNDWRYLSVESERAILAYSIKGKKGPNRQVAEQLGNKFKMQEFSSFVPRIVLDAIVDKQITANERFDIIVDQFNGALAFVDASGFTALSAVLANQVGGGEKLGECINNFFTPLIEIISLWGGDIIKFSGDALTIVWPLDEDKDADGKVSDDVGVEMPSSDASLTPTQSTPRLRSPLSRSSTRHYGVEPEPSARNESATGGMDAVSACRLACQCCVELHNNLHNFPTPAEGRFLTVHIGVGYGKVTVLQVGGVLDRWEYVVAGPPLEQISIAEPLAGPGETCLSPQVVSKLAEWRSLTTEELEVMPNGYCRLLRLNGGKLAPPPPLETITLQDEDVELLRRFIPPAVFKRLSAGHSAFIDEMRKLSVIFCQVRGLDVSTEKGNYTAHLMMSFIQRAAYTFEGSVNKFLVDDKGVLILVMMGLPPVYHLDDPMRAVACAIRISERLRSMGLDAGIGITTGRVWVGTVGCEKRKEYTAMGNVVNMAARLMAKARMNEIYVDLETYSLTNTIFCYNRLKPMRVKGRTTPLEVFSITGQLFRNIGLDAHLAIGPPRQITPLKPHHLTRLHHALSRAQTHLSSNNSALMHMNHETVHDLSEVSALNPVTPITTWPKWKCKRWLMRLLLPNYTHKRQRGREGVAEDSESNPDPEDPPPSDAPPLDYPLYSGPAFPWEYYEPWHPVNKPVVDLGGVVMIKGNARQGLKALVDCIELVGKQMGREVVVCSNLPEKLGMPIGGVPLIAWRKACSEMVCRWRSANCRSTFGHSRVNRDNSVYGCAKELIHPMFHARLPHMRGLIRGLILPCDVPENREASRRVRAHQLKSSSKGRAPKMRSDLIRDRHSNRYSYPKSDRHPHPSITIKPGGIDDEVHRDGQTRMKFGDVLSTTTRRKSQPTHLPGDMQTLHVGSGAKETTRSHSTPGDTSIHLNEPAAPMSNVLDNQPPSILATSELTSTNLVTAETSQSSNSPVSQEGVPGDGHISALPLISVDDTTSPHPIRSGRSRTSSNDQSLLLSSESTFGFDQSFDAITERYDQSPRTVSEPCGRTNVKLGFDKLLRRNSSDHPTTGSTFGEAPLSTKRRSTGYRGPSSHHRRLPQTEEDEPEKLVSNGNLKQKLLPPASPHPHQLIVGRLNINSDRPSTKAPIPSDRQRTLLGVEEKLQRTRPRSTRNSSVFNGRPMRLQSIHDDNDPHAQSMTDSDEEEVDAHAMKRREILERSITLAPVITSLVNGFTMAQPTILCLHVEKGTSLFADIDGDSWEVALQIAQAAMTRRASKIAADLVELKQWRRNHCRQCGFCMGFLQPYSTLSGDQLHPYATAQCKPPPSTYFSPFVFFIVVNDSCKMKYQKELINFAEDCQAFLQIKKMEPSETASYLAHCLDVPRRSLPHELVEYVHRVSAGLPDYVYLTSQHLLSLQAIRVRRYPYHLSHRKTVTKLLDEDEETLGSLSENGSSSATSGHSQDENDITRELETSEHNKVYQNEGKSEGAIDAVQPTLVRSLLPQQLSPRGLLHAGTPGNLLRSQTNAVGSDQRLKLKRFSSLPGSNIPLPYIRKQRSGGGGAGSLLYHYYRCVAHQGKLDGTEGAAQGVGTPGSPASQSRSFTSLQMHRSLSGDSLVFDPPTERNRSSRHSRTQSWGPSEMGAKSSNPRLYDTPSPQTQPSDSEQENMCAVHDKNMVMGDKFIAIYTALEKKCDEYAFRTYRRLYGKKERRGCLPARSSSIPHRPRNFGGIDEAPLLSASTPNSIGSLGDVKHTDRLLNSHPSFLSSMDRLSFSQYDLIRRSGSPSGAAGHQLSAQGNPQPGSLHLRQNCRFGMRPTVPFSMPARTLGSIKAMKNVYRVFMPLPRLKRGSLSEMKLWVPAADINDERTGRIGLCDKIINFSEGHWWALPTPLDFQPSASTMPKPFTSFFETETQSLCPAAHEVAVAKRLRLIPSSGKGNIGRRTLYQPLDSTNEGYALHLSGTKHNTGTVGSVVELLTDDWASLPFIEELVS